MPSWLQQKIRAKAEQPARVEVSRVASPAQGRSAQAHEASSSRGQDVSHAPQRKRARALAAASSDPSLSSQSGAAADWSEESNGDEPVRAAEPRPKRQRASPQRRTHRGGTAARRAQIHERRVTEPEEEYSSPNSLDPNEPEFPKLVDPPFISALVPLVLSPSDQLQGGQTTLHEAPEDAVPLTVPASAAQYLREYQKDGIRWLYQQYIRNLGGILGDDMGTSFVRLGSAAWMHIRTPSACNACWLDIVLLAVQVSERLVCA